MWQIARFTYAERLLTSYVSVARRACIQLYILLHSSLQNDGKDRRRSAKLLGLCAAVVDEFGEHQTACGAQLPQTEKTRGVRERKLDKCLHFIVSQWRACHEQIYLSKLEHLSSWFIYILFPDSDRSLFNWRRVCSTCGCSELPRKRRVTVSQVCYEATNQSRRIFSKWFLF